MQKKEGVGERLKVFPLGEASGLEVTGGRAVREGHEMVCYNKEIIEQRCIEKDGHNLLCGEWV